MVDIRVSGRAEQYLPVGQGYAEIIMPVVNVRGKVLRKKITGEVQVLLGRLQSRGACHDADKCGLPADVRAVRPASDPLDAVRFGEALRELPGIYGDARIRRQKLAEVVLNAHTD